MATEKMCVRGGVEGKYNLEKRPETGDCQIHKGGIPVTRSGANGQEQQERGEGFRVYWVWHTSNGMTEEALAQSRQQPQRKGGTTWRKRLEGARGRRKKGEAQRNADEENRPKMKKVCVRNPNEKKTGNFKILRYAWREEKKNVTGKKRDSGMLERRGNGRFGA